MSDATVDGVAMTLGRRPDQGGSNSTAQKYDTAEKSRESGAQEVELVKYSTTPEEIAAIWRIVWMTIAAVFPSFLCVVLFLIRPFAPETVGELLKLVFPLGIVSLLSVIWFARCAKRGTL